MNLAGAMVAGLFYSTFSVPSPVSEAVMDEGAFRPVYYGGELEMDACSAVAEVAGLNPRGDGFLSVRSGPGRDFQKTDMLYNGDTVYLCDGEGEWLGVVYGSPEAPVSSCAVASPKSARQPYDGPCPSGWVHSRWVRLTAG